MAAARGCEALLQTPGENLSQVLLSGLSGLGLGRSQGLLQVHRLRSFILMLMVDIDVSLEADNIPREQVELAWRFWRRAKGEQKPGGRLARRL